METLPAEIISTIGKFLCIKDRKACLEASKIFQHVTVNFKHHELKFTPGDVDAKLRRLPHLLRYVRKTKPSLNSFTFQFHDVNLFGAFLYPPPGLKEDIASILAAQGVKEVELIFKNCDDNFVTHAMNLFSKCHAVKAEVLNLNLQGDETWLYDAPVKTVITSTHAHSSRDLMGKMTHIPNVVLYEGDITVIDLSLMNSEKCTVMFGSTREFAQRQYVDLGRATTISFHPPAYITRDIVDALKADAMPGGCGVRIKEVFIRSPFKHIECNVWKEFIDILPNTTKYKISTEDPQCVWYLHELKKRGVNDIKIHCGCRQTWLAGNFYKKCFDEPYELIACRGFKQEYTSDDLVTVDDFFNAMDASAQSLWFPVYMMWKRFA